MALTKKKILFIIPAMHGGGAERVFSLLLKFINREKYVPVLVLVKREGVFLKNIPLDVEVVDLKCKRIRNAWLKIILVIWKQRPDIVFSTLGPLNLIIALFKFILPARVKYISRESNLISLHNRNENSPAIFNFLFRTVYKKFDLIICQSNDMKADLKNNFMIPDEKMIVINNPVDVEEIKLKRFERSLDTNAETYFLAAGRLDVQKGFDRLVEAFSLIEPLNVHLYIIGTGPLEEKLKKQVSDLNLTQAITFLGFQENPYIYMNSCKALIMTSHYEGFPNVAIEANACGVPIISFNCPGTREAIVEGLNGWLIEQGNVRALAQKIQQVSTMEFDKNRIIEHVRSKYNVNLIVNKYEAVFDT